MTTIKSYTDLEQSHKLAKILPLESADMWWSKCTITDFGDGVLKVSYAVEPCNISQFRNTKEDIPCWSFTALLGVLPSGYVIVKNYHSFYYVESRDHSKSTNIFDNPIDACVAMIEQLYKLNLL